MAFGIGASISPILYWVVRDRTGGYDAILSADVLLFAAAGAVLLLLGRYPAAAAGAAGELAPAQAR
jgi:hypothetical protein